jgi:hypothetical protein
MADLEKCLNPNSPTGALLLLDIIIMFNKTSRKDCHASCWKTMNISACCFHFSTCGTLSMTAAGAKKPDGTFDAFQQTEGFAQGCPVSAFLACLALHILLADVNTQLKSHATAQKANHTCLGDDNLGCLAQTKFFVDA